jgi:hypothetical protein
VTRADECSERCQLALDYGIPEQACRPGACHYANRMPVDFAAALVTAQQNKSFSNLARAYIELVRRAQAGQQALAGVTLQGFDGYLRQFSAEPWLRSARDAANDLEPLTHLKVKKHG